MLEGCGEVVFEKVGVVEERAGFAELWCRGRDPSSELSTSLHLALIKTAIIHDSEEKVALNTTFRRIAEGGLQLWCVLRKALECYWKLIGETVCTELSGYSDTA
jgi:hypothetical protein